ncbi:ABC transporter permease [Modestobacter sp. I12A-02628]|uniref:ABC transporter permease n=1 Tax=Goekera deserti TaxID=2497753 RepID=A0A7K3W9Z1_9ACTN|nr:ABC transporter permease [Goekera deserti]MPQ99127.1 ABC transporter permease [Goekera deserti]NDI47461.1 ABC transporter permease [Goekera deserti]NEL53272.1 ABC transporter permease [Goekera deserti]
MTTTAGNDTASDGTAGNDTAGNDTTSSVTTSEGTRTVAPVGPAAPGRRWHRPSAYVERYALVAVWLVVVVAFGLARPETYATTGNLQNILGSQAVLLILALGLLIPLTTGGFDLSVTSTLSLSAMLVAVLNVQHGWSLPACIAAAVAASVVVGLVNGACVVLLGIDSFIVTLGTSTFVLGLVQWLSDSTAVTGVDPALTEWTVVNRLFGVSLSFYYGLLAAVATWFLLTRMPLGRRLLFVGRGASVARLSGLAVDRIRWGSFVTSAVVAGLAGVVYAGSLGGADPSSGSSFLLPAFAAAYLGATAITPGRFNAVGTFVAVYFLVSGVVGLQMLGVDNFVQQLFYGGALVVAVALSQLVRRRTSGAG